MRFHALRLLTLFLFCFTVLPCFSADPELEKGFIFGSRNLTVENPNAPGTDYIMVHHSGGDGAVDEPALEYNADDGFGFEVINPDATGWNRLAYNCSFDNTPNGRNRFDDVMPEELYDSFIGFKNNPICHSGMDEIADDNTPCCDGLAPAGGAFRIDVPNGFYRFVGAFGEADNLHASRVVAEDGGTGSIGIGEDLCALENNSVVLVHNHAQRDFDIGYQGDGEGVFARVGFLDKLPPEGNGEGNDPAFINMDNNGLPTDCPPNSPVLEVTNGYIRIHLLQGNAPRSDTAGADGADMVLLEIWSVDSAEVPEMFSVEVERSIDTEKGSGFFLPDEEVTITLTTSGVQNSTVIEETFPVEMVISDNGGGTVVDNTISFTVDADGAVSYKLTAPAEGDLAIAGTVIPEAPGCPGDVTGNSSLSLWTDPFPCVPTAEDETPELQGAFAFGSRNLTIALHNDPAVNYTMIHHAGNDAVSHGALAYTVENGYGFEIIDPGNTGRNGSAQFGPFDDSPNNRGEYNDEAAEQLYDSFIGLKNYTSPCNATTVGDMFTPCELADTPIGPEGAIFIVDVPNGIYKFVAAVGEADNPHANRLLAEDGGSGPPSQIGENFVTLVNNHDQAQYNVGHDGTKPGAGAFGRVGFNCRITPLGDGLGNDPQFINMGTDGVALTAGDDGVYSTPDDPPPESPSLEVTQGYIRFHLLQGNSNNGPGGKNFNPDTGIGDSDPNGTDIVALEVWKVGGFKTSFIRGDTNGDNGIDISDAITVLGYLFGAPDDSGKIKVPNCFDAADANDSGSIDLADAISILGSLFGGEGPLPAPNECGIDTTEEGDDLDCAEYTCPE